MRMKALRRRAIGGWAQLRALLPHGLQDALTHLPTGVTPSTRDLCRERSWACHDLDRDSYRPHEPIAAGCRDLSAALASNLPRGGSWPRFVAEIPRGRVLGSACIAIAPPGIVLADVSPHPFVPASQHRGLTGAVWSPPPRRLRGVAALLGGSGRQNYYHWLFDMIPRVESIREARDGAAVDHWIVPRSRLPVVDELLDRFGIDRRRVVRLGRGEQVECDLLLATSSPTPLGGPVARSIGFLRRHLRDEQLNEAASRRRLLLQRGASRRIANLDELAATIADLRLEIVSTEGMSLATQMETFGNAELLVGVHGAGLSNAIAMFGDAALIEIVPRWYPVACYCVLAKEAGIRYFAMDADPADGRPTRNPHADLRIDPDRLREAVHAVGANAVR